MIEIWDKKKPINGVNADDVLNSDPILRSSEVVLTISDNTGRVEQINSVDILRSNLKLDNSLTPLQVGEAYLKSLEQQNNNSANNIDTNLEGRVLDLENYILEKETDNAISL